MPQRPRSHRIEDESRRVLEAAVDPHFRFYPRTPPEYGIDGELEEFDDQDRGTGLHFYAQLKATDEPDLARALAVSIDLDTANYYRAAPLPVLMVRYVAANESLYCRWFHQYDPYYGRGGAQTLTFRWQPTDQLEDETVAGLADDARAFLELGAAALRLPRPVYLTSVEAFGFDPAELGLAFRAAARERPAEVVPVGGRAPAGAIEVQIGADEIRVDLAKVTGAALHIVEPGYPGTFGAEQVAVDSMVLLALAFERVGQDELVSRFASTFLARSSFASDIDVAFAVSAAMSRAHRILEALELSDAFDDPDSEEMAEVAQVFGFPALYKARSLSERELTAHIETLRLRAKRRKGNPHAAAEAYMNLANCYRALNRWAPAVSHYKRVLKLDPAYADRAYYWFELGGALWGTDQFDQGAEAYARAIELGTDEPLAPALQADALLFAGRYAEALTLFRGLKLGDADDGEYRLKTRVSQAIVERLGIAQQRRRTKRAIAAAPVSELDNAHAWQQAASAQLALDALWGSAWLNMGLSEDELGFPERALDSFIAATVLIPQDHEAWIRALIGAFRLDEDVIFDDLVRCGLRLGGDPLMADVLSTAREPAFPVPRVDFVQQIERTVSQAATRPRPGFTVRMIQPDGSVETITIEEKGDDAPPDRTQ